MAVAFDGTRIADAQSLAPTTPVAGDWEDITGAGATLEDNFFYNGTACVAELVKGTEFGIDFIPDTNTYNGTNIVWIFKASVNTSGLLGTTRVTGQKMEIGSGGTAGAGRPANYHQWYANILTTYPATGGWVLIAIDTDEIGFIDNTVGTPDMSVTNYWGHVATMTSTAVKAPNVGMGALDYVAPGKGLTWTSTGGTFAAFTAFDEGTVGNRYGIVSTRGGVIYCQATLTIGSAAACTFSDANQKLVFTWQRVGAGAQGVAVDLSNASTAVDISVCSFTGNGDDKTKKFFDTALQVNGTTEVFTIPGHGFNTGDYVQYNDEGGTTLTGLTDLLYYWVYVIDADTFALHATRASAYGDTTRVGVTAASPPGENHSITRNPDNRLDFTVTGTSGTFSADSCIFEGVRILTLTSACTIVSGFIQSIGNVVASTATFTNVNVSDATLEEGVALFTPLASLNGIVGCSFTSSGDGHAFELTSTGSTDCDANSFTDYWSPQISGSNNGWEFHTITGVDATNDIITTNANHGFTTGDAVYYNNEGGTDTIGLTNLAKYYVKVLSTTTFTMHATKAAAVAGSSIINLSDGSGGETQAIYGGNAVVYNNSGGSATINVLNLGDTPSVRNGSGASTTVVNTKTLTVTCLNTAGTPIQGVRVRIEAAAGGSLISEGTTNSSGVYQDTTYPYTAPVAVNVIARLKGFVFNKASDNITVNGLSVPFTMVKDSAVNLP